MGLFGQGKPKRIVVKQYGGDSSLGLASPMAAYLLRSEGSGVEKMEKDALAMAKQGYRIVSTQEQEHPTSGVRYLKVTYELGDPPDATTPPSPAE
jgi:hypothetical protein